MSLDISALFRFPIDTFQNDKGWRPLEESKVETEFQEVFGHQEQGVFYSVLIRNRAHHHLWSPPLLPSLFCASLSLWFHLSPSNLSLVPSLKKQETVRSLLQTQLFVLLHIHAPSVPNPSSRSLLPFHIFVFRRLSGPVRGIARP